ncbi:response regulator [candidate division KSB1 bacterium]|nr:response regulator [candidate division KSB1 bacterium]
MKTDFFANISHEFRTPLTLILGPVEQMLDKAETQDKNRLLHIRRNARRLLQLVNQLLDLSKIDSGNVSLKVTSGDFVAFLKGLVMSFESLAERKGIALRFSVQPCEGSEPSQGSGKHFFDRDKIEKIFTNLLSNAFKFTHEGGMVSVHVVQINKCRKATAQPDKEEFVKPCMDISVTDTGEGIPAQQLPYIFDRFYQVDSSSQRTHGGTGIGLAMVKQLVELHYGSIRVISNEGKGTTFTISLPLGREHVHQSEFAENFQENEFVPDVQTESLELEFMSLKTDPDSVGKKEKNSKKRPAADRPILLIIEDNADVRAYIREQLETEYIIHEAADGKAGVAQAIEVIPDLVISDVMMPKMDGYEVCHTLKTDERTSHIPVILLTAKAGDEAKLAGLETGADDYILKPFRQQELAVRVRNLISLRRKLRQRFSTATVIKPSEIETTSMDREFLERAIAVVEENIGEEHFTAESLANTVAMSVSQLNRKLNALIDQPAGQLIRTMRLQRAAEMLAKKAGTVAEICYVVGFSDQANFTRSFKKQFGCSPSQYQKSHLK